ncbi:T9SS type A sorting domain-containing protein [Hymenobacter lucidus]|uniref:T9SS type A sorting domain-containing protein n=1 Tax=Hymenobacter lucidus TaxID=2880930 RepID=A0ABS8ARD6_9BACT|nr:T9SS type A sorting domain-containing protein [Hymenobacter lucidus]MCB2408304.1 T9SS type A sorting domain-containing protein [Hymenobacter lucidus]
MKKQLLTAALGLFSLGALHAQSGPEMAGRQLSELPRELRQLLAKKAVAVAPARRATTVRKPGKSAIYNWNYLGNQWATTARVEVFSYDASGQTTQIVEQDSITGQLHNRVSWTYNAAGAQTSSLNEIWNNAAWQNQSRSQDAYNSAGLLTEHLEQVWQNGAWQNLFRATVQYDAHNRYLAWSNEEWRNNAWVTTYGGRATRTYNAAGAVVEELESLLDTATGIYQPNTRYLYTYPSASSLLVSGQVSQRWQSGAYVNQQRVSNFVYDAQDRVISSEGEGWINGSWQLENRFTTTYLPNGSSQGLFEQRQNNAWVGLYRYAHSYDEWGNELGNVSESFANNVWTIGEAYRYLLRYNAAHDLLAKVRQNYNTTSKAYESSLKHTYSDFQSITLGTKPTAALAAQTQLYPNPTTGVATLELPNLPGSAPMPVEVVNGLGQVVQRLTLPPHQSQVALDLSALPTGIYSVQLHTAVGLIVKKVVRQ